MGINIKQTTTLAFFSVVLSGCGILHHNNNKLLGKWELGSVTTVPGAPAFAEEIADKLNSLGAGEIYTFKKHGLEVQKGNNTPITVKDKYLVKDDGNIVYVLQKQEKFGSTITEKQKSVFSDGGKDVALTSGMLILHMHKIS